MKDYQEITGCIEDFKMFLNQLNMIKPHLFNDANSSLPENI